MRGGLFPVPFPSGDSWPKVTQDRMGFQGQGPRSPGLWTTPAHGHCMPQTNTRRVQTNNIFVYVGALRIPCGKDNTGC
uniref:proline-rich protein 26-like n=1 Tax=Macaca mulatta TaxID=9544 RepID=UPI0010A2407D|nr:proline-rich protein 26-like [Macaca mulatta]